MNEKHKDEGKPNLGLLSPVAMQDLGLVLGFGAGKYEPHGWRKGGSYSRHIASAMRHLMAMLGGQNKDPETGLPHAAHAMARCMYLDEYVRTGTGEDDRWIPDSTFTIADISDAPDRRITEPAISIAEISDAAEKALEDAPHDLCQRCFCALNQWSMDLGICGMCRANE